MHIHGSCGSREGAGVLLVGPPGSGKSDLLLRLLDRGFSLVADDQVVVEHGDARAPAALAGLLEVRGLGIVRLRHQAHTRLSLVVELGEPVERLPEPALHAELGLPLLRVNPTLASAPAIVAMALDCVLGLAAPVAGAFGDAAGDVPPNSLPAGPEQ